MKINKDLVMDTVLLKGVDFPAPCVFCGQSFVQTVIETSGETHYHVRCFTCGAVGPVGDYDTAVSLWNKRTEPPYAGRVIVGEFADDPGYHQEIVKIIPNSSTRITESDPVTGTRINYGAVYRIDSQYHTDGGKMMFRYRFSGIKEI